MLLTARTSFLFDLEGAEQTQTVHDAASLPDALTLLNQLAPTLQALAVTDQIAHAEPETMSVLAEPRTVQSVGCALLHKGDACT
ncbi:hypothetical protein BJP40_23925 [Streptomyces sp. CC53]|uniref:hypothetical protein n=1 Tax=Streptomyces sp. CC53 TaxID=1906740 RepID=UPI0008DC7931|nr:hypothetical protein [Streptomyces sp. CC53]OII63405.1 hypothetical protein BJP40_23925 [Streptomyces sp. CC53]